MQLSDAITVTALGMAVVFSGLLLTAGLISAFGRLQRLIDGVHRQTDEPPASITDSAGEIADPPTGPPIDPEVLTVIATVLEIEHRLQRVARVSAKPVESP
jgi:Na+-transporting methylmalonyl-CoA/oxaloacetate decarboxylase gamma subunit